MRIFLNDAAFYDGGFLDEYLGKRGEVSFEGAIGSSAGGFGELANSGFNVARLVGVDGNGGDADFVVEQSLNGSRGGHLRIVIGDDDDVLGAGVGVGEAELAGCAVEGEGDGIFESWAYRQAASFLIAAISRLPSPLTRAEHPSGRPRHRGRRKRS